MFFLADLVRAHGRHRHHGLHGAVELCRRHDVVRRSARASRTSTTDSQDRHVIIVEDIVDTGLTLNYLQEILRARGPKSLRTACLLT